MKNLRSAVATVLFGVGLAASAVCSAHTPNSLQATDAVASASNDVTFATPPQSDAGAFEVARVDGRIQLLGDTLKRAQTAGASLIYAPNGGVKGIASDGKSMVFKTRRNHDKTRTVLVHEEFSKSAFDTGIVLPAKSTPKVLSLDGDDDDDITFEDMVSDLEERALGRRDLSNIFRPTATYSAEQCRNDKARATAECE